MDEEDSWRLKEAHYNLKDVARADGSLRQYAFHDVIQLSPDGRIVRVKSGRIKRTRRFLHVEILEDELGRPIRKGYMTDHVRNGGLNNRRPNLRELTNGQNVAKQRKRTKATSKYKGVSKHPCGLYKMVNSVRRLHQMKAFMRGQLQDWDCRAEQNSLIIRTDGSLAPCFPLYSATCDWGMTGRPNFNSKQLLEIKHECQAHCFSTLNHTLAYCYDAGRIFRWLLKQAANGFRGTTGSVED